MLQHLIAAFVALIVSVSGALAHDAGALANALGNVQLFPLATSPRVRDLRVPDTSQTAAAVYATSPVAPINPATSIIDAALAATPTDTNSNSSNQQDHTARHLAGSSSPQNSPPQSPLSRSPTLGLVLGIATSAADIVTRAELDAAVNTLRSQVFSFTSFCGPAASTPISVAAFAPSQRIDELTGTTLSNVTVNGVSGLTASDIPTNITAANYLPLSGGTLTGSLTGTNLTLSGNLTVAGAQTLSGAITIPYLTATSTTIASSFYNASTTLFSALGSAYFGSTATSSFAATGALTLATPLAVSSGGTGTSTAPSYGKLLVGNFRGTYDLLATSTLGIVSGGTPGGSGTQIQFNNYGAFGGSAAFTFATSTGTLSVTSVSATNATTGAATSTNLAVFAAPIATAHTATSTTLASTFPYASSTAITVSGTSFFGTASTSNLTISNIQSSLLRLRLCLTGGAHSLGSLSVAGGL